MWCPNLLLTNNFIYYKTNVLSKIWLSFIVTHFIEWGILINCSWWGTFSFCNRWLVKKSSHVINWNTVLLPLDSCRLMKCLINGLKCCFNTNKLADKPFHFTKKIYYKVLVLMNFDQWQLCIIFQINYNNAISVLITVFWELVVERVRETPVENDACIRAIVKSCVLFLCCGSIPILGVTVSVSESVQQMTIYI